jgi:hypothetical protein
MHFVLNFIFAIGLKNKKLANFYLSATKNSNMLHIKSKREVLPIIEFLLKIFIYKNFHFHESAECQIAIFYG